MATREKNTNKITSFFKPLTDNGHHDSKENADEKLKVIDDTAKILVHVSSIYNIGWKEKKIGRLWAADSC